VLTTRFMGVGIFGAAIAGFALLAGGCNSDAPEQRAMPAQPADDTSKDFGAYEVHYNAVRTDLLGAEIARSYGIQRGTNRVMLNVAVRRKEGQNGPRGAVEADVQVAAYNLNGQTKDLQMRRVSEGDAIYYIGEVSIAGAEILVFNISVTPAGESAPLTMTLRREFQSG
jgi:hypothetical protein